MHSIVQNTVFIIPCFNEAIRLDIDQYTISLKRNENLKLFFIDDGSTDSTVSKLQELKEIFKNQVEIFPLKQNIGKAEAVRYGMLKAIQQNEKFDFFGFLDADLATSLDETLRLSTVLKKEHLDMVFGSRISMVGTIISRNKYRHVIGRVIATFISNILRLRVYDTQCGAKVFFKRINNSNF